LIAFLDAAELSGRVKWPSSETEAIQGSKALEKKIKKKDVSWEMKDRCEARTAAARQPIEEDVRLAITCLSAVHMYRRRRR